MCSEGAELASVSSSEANTFLGSLTQDHTWLGGNDVVAEGTYTWTDGTSWSYDNWRFNAPNNGNGNSEQDCVILRSDGEWDDVSCSTSRNFVCEKPAAGQAALAANPACSCESGWTASYDTGGCYKRGDAVASHDVASAACQAEGAELASVASETENVLVHSVLTADGNNNNGWLGATDTVTDGTWEWEDGTSWTYQNWWATAALGTQGGTNQNCLQLRRIDLTWDDAKFSAEKWYVCEK